MGGESVSLEAAENYAEAAPPPPGASSATSGQGHSAASVFTRLWIEKRRGAQIELRYGDGQSLVPTAFAPRMSQGRLGVFGVRENDGSYTLISIPWDSITEVTVRGVKRLPEEMGD